MALLSAFNPHEFSEATVRTIATGRDDDLDDVLATIRANLASETIQHLIVSAPRGYGKSFMMRHIQIEVERLVREESLPLAVVLMPEEMPHVKEPETLVRELARALAGGAGADAELTWHEDEGSAWEGAIAALATAVAEKVGSQGLVVALVENFDILLRRAFPKEVQAAGLRNLLTATGSRLMLIAASATGAFDRNYDAPLFRAFREVELTPWTIEQCLAFFDRQREAAGKPPLDEPVRARAKAVASFIGGTPRLATLLGEVLFDQDVLRAADLLRDLVDELTPYYKERVEALAGRSQKLLDALLRGGEPTTQSEIARRVKANSQAAIAGPFNDLVRERIVIGEKAPGSAEVLYRVADRVFAQYYRRRVIDHGVTACPLEAMVDLLATFFSADEKKAKAAEFAHLGRLREARVMARLHAAESGAGQAGWSGYLRNLSHSYGRRHLLPLASAAAADHLRAIFDLIDQDRIDEAYVRIETALASLRSNDCVLVLLARSRIDAAEGIGHGRAAAEEATLIAEKAGDDRLATLAGLGRAWTLNIEEKYVAALDLSTELARNAVDIHYVAAALRHGAYSLRQLGRNEEAIENARRAADLAIEAGDKGETALILRYGAYSLAELGRHEEAVEWARRAADLAVEAGDEVVAAVALRHSAYSLGQLGRYEESVKSARRATDLATEAGDKGVAAVALRHGAYSLGQRGRHEEAIEWSRRAADLAVEAGDKREAAEALRHGAYSLGQLGRDEEAIEWVRRAVALANEMGDLRERALALCVAGYCLFRLERRDEAIETARMATDLGKTTGEFDVLNDLAWNFAKMGEQAVVALSAAAEIVDRHPSERDAESLTATSRWIASRQSMSFAGDTFDVAQLHALLGVLADRLDLDGSLRLLFQEWMREFAQEAAARIADADRLETLAAAVDLRFPARFGAETSLLRDAAGYHRGGRDPSALARLDPDVARTLQIMFPPREGTSEKKKRKPAARAKR